MRGWGHRHVHWTDLSWADLSWADLSWADLSWADLFPHVQDLTGVQTLRVDPYPGVHSGGLNLSPIESLSQRCGAPPLPCSEGQRLERWCYVPNQTECLRREARSFVSWHPALMSHQRRHLGRKMPHVNQAWRRFLPEAQCFATRSRCAMTSQSEKKLHLRRPLRRVGQYPEPLNWACGHRPMNVGLRLSANHLGGKRA